MVLLNGKVVLAELWPLVMSAVLQLVAMKPSYMFVSPVLNVWVFPAMHST